MSVPSFLAAKTGSGSLLNVWTLAVHLPRVATDLVSTHAMLPWHQQTPTGPQSRSGRIWAHTNHGHCPANSEIIYSVIKSVKIILTKKQHSTRQVMRGQGRLCIAILSASGWKLQVGYHFKFYSRELSPPTSQLPVVIKRKNTAERGEGGETNEILN